MTGIFGIGVSGLNAAQRALATTGNNISNVNTPGYARQRVDLANRQDQVLGGSSVGKGVDVANIRRVVNEFLETNLQNSNSNVGTQQSYTRYASQLDALLGNEATGLSSSLQRFFDSLNGVANDPASLENRQTLLSDAQALTEKFNTLGTQVNRLENGINAELKASVNEVNTLTASIAEINQNLAIVGPEGSNALQDQLGNAVNELSKLVKVNTLRKSDGTLDVFSSGGQLLVSGSSKINLGTQPNAQRPNQLDITLPIGANISVITNSLQGGEIGGLLEARTEIIENSRNSLGRIAAGLAQVFNTQHNNGEDLTGNAGTDLFSIPGPVVSAIGTASGTAAVTFDPAAVNGLTTSDYRLDYNGTNYTLTRLNDNTQVYSAAGAAFNVDGLNFNVTGAVNGDSFLIKPTESVAGQISVQITDPRNIAAAGPGTGIGDNSNILALADLQTSFTLSGNSASFNDAYGQLVGDIGTKTREANNSLAAMEAVLENATNARESVSGVNLDEEAADLLKFQQAYQASARVISVGNDIFGTLLQAIGR